MIISDYIIKNDGIYCSVTIIDTLYGRIINSMTDEDIKKNFRFGLPIIVSSDDIKDNSICTYGTFEIPYVVLSECYTKYTVDKIERV